MAAVANLRMSHSILFSSDVTVTNSDGDVVDLTGYTTEAKTLRVMQTNCYNNGLSIASDFPQQVS